MFTENNIGINNQKNRELWLENTLKKIPKGSLILDVGAGEQQYRKFCTHLRYKSQDFAKYDGKGDGRGKQTKKWYYSKLDIVSDITKIPRPNKSFDAVMCIEVLEHVPDPIAAIKEFSRLLKKNGYLIITAPFCSLTHFSPYHFYSGFNKYFYEKFLPENGFRIIKITSNGNYFEYLAQEIRRVQLVANKYSRSTQSIFVRIIMKFLTDLYLVFVASISRNCLHSEELLCFGYHVLAKKNE